MRNRVLWVGGIWGLIGALCVVVEPVAAAEPPQVEFDLARAVACQEATPPEFAALHPEEKVIAVTFRVSVRLKAGQADDLEELVIDITSPEQRLRVLDFAPDTQLESTAGDVEISTTSEKVRSLGTSLGGKVDLPTWPVDAHLVPSADVGTTNREVVTETVKKPSPQQVVLTSGTTNQGYGVFFKLRRSLQSSLEGMHEFQCRMIVPRDWSGDWLLVACRARGVRSKYFVKSIEPCGDTRAYVGLYLLDDSTARRAAFRLAHLQGQGSATQVASSGGDPLVALTHFVSDTTAILAGEPTRGARRQSHAERLAHARAALARCAGQP